MNSTQAQEVIYRTLSRLLPYIPLPLSPARVYPKKIQSKLDKDCLSLLDVGCGEGTLKSVECLRSVGVDVELLSLTKAKGKGNYSDCIRGDVRALPFKAKSFDIVLCVEVIEHLEKIEGVDFIKQLEEVAAKQLIITTPWGYTEPWKGIYNDSARTHVSGWLPTEFRQLGYETSPIYYFRYPSGFGKLRYGLARYALTLLLYPLIRMYPERFAIGFMALKRLQGG